MNPNTNTNLNSLTSTSTINIHSLVQNLYEQTCLILNTDQNITTETFADYQNGVESTIYSLREIHSSIHDEPNSILDNDENDNFSKYHQELYDLESNIYRVFKTYINKQNEQWKKDYKSARIHIANNIKRLAE